MKTPSDSELIYDLIESFGHLCEPEPPLYSCYCDVAAIKEVEDKVRLAEVVTLNGFRCAAAQNTLMRPHRLRKHSQHDGGEDKAHHDFEICSSRTTPRYAVSCISISPKSASICLKIGWHFL